ncbi:MAG TPA: type I methionyl aminopeptidase [Microbacteriaceae bacterium]|nr:type I methionyl aminopeptidase [Microbacteriaceae bacterium]
MRGMRHTIYKTPAQLRLMIPPGLATAASLDACEAALRPGITTGELDRLAERAIRDLGAEPNFVLEPGYHNTVCASVNDEVVHGIPGTRVVRAGDLVSIDSGAIQNGWNGDAARSFVVPDEDRPDVVAARARLNEVTRRSLWHGIAALAAASYLYEVGAAIEGFVRSQGDYGVLTDYVGHGIGRHMHEDPPVPNYRVKQKGPEVRPGLVVAIEPMITQGSPATSVRPDGWTVVTDDHGDAAHWEHTVAVHKDGIWVLTAADGGARELAEFGIVPVRPA